MTGAAEVRNRQPRRVFPDRTEAGRVLAGLLDAYRDRDDVIVLGLARVESRSPGKSPRHRHRRRRVGRTSSTEGIPRSAGCGAAGTGHRRDLSTGDRPISYPTGL